MAKEIIFIGGGDYRKQENRAIDKYLIKIIKPEMKILIIPFASRKEKYVSWASALFVNFSKYHIKNFSILDIDLPKEVMIDRIKESDVLFLTGGLPNVLIEALSKKGLISIIRNYHGIIIGYSAGALAICRDCIILPEEGHPGKEIIRGLGLCDFSVYVHYSKDQDKDLSEFSKERKIYAICDKSAIVLKNGKMSFIGDSFLFDKNKAKVFIASTD